MRIVTYNLSLVQDQSLDKTLELKQSLKKIHIIKSLNIKSLITQHIHISSIQILTPLFVIRHVHQGFVLSDTLVI